MTNSAPCSDERRSSLSRGLEVRATILISQPIQYFAPGLRLLAGNPDIQSTVYYWNPALGGVYDAKFNRHIRWSGDLHSGYEWWAPPGRSAPLRRAAIWQRLRGVRPDVILSFGWASPIARVGIAYAITTRTPLLFLGDTNGRGPDGCRHPRLRRLVLRQVFRHAGAVSTGAFNREFYLANGMPAERVHPGVLPADVDPFIRAGAARRFPAGAVRPAVIGFAGKLIPAKAAADLIEAVAGLDRRHRWQLWVIGDGPQRGELESLAALRGVADRVRFLGFRNTDELPGLMANVDIMVMPSRREPRGLVPIEAMAAGAAVVVSSATGVWGPGDAVQHGETGLVYPVGDIPALTAVLSRLLDEPDTRHWLAAAGHSRAPSFGPREFADSTAAALAAAVEWRHHWVKVRW